MLPLINQVCIHLPKALHTTKIPLDDVLPSHCINSVIMFCILSSYPIHRVSEEEKIDDALVKITSSGHVTWTQRNVLKTSCQIDMQNYPFDLQNCHMILHSSSYTKKEVT